MNKKAKQTFKRIRAVILLIILILLIVGGITLWNSESRKNAIPTISLIGDSNITLKMNEEYVEEGAKAIRNKEDITSSIVVDGNVDTSKPGEYKIKYSAANEKNTKSADIERTVTIIDDIAPTIVLNGKDKVTVNLNESYKDEGCRAQDNYDGDITNKVSITGEVDTKKEGEYTITYTVEDSSSNKTEVTRKVTVAKKQVTSTSTKKRITSINVPLFL